MEIELKLKNKKTFATNLLRQTRSTEMKLFLIVCVSTYAAVNRQKNIDNKTVGPVLLESQFKQVMGCRVVASSLYTTCHTSRPTYRGLTFAASSATQIKQSS